MKKTVIVINGSGGVGKDTLCDMAAKHYKVYNVSSITPIKNVAKMCGWNGEKDDRSRKFLSDLKRLTVEYNDFPTKWLMNEYKTFAESEDEIMFVHIREPEEIEKFVKACDGMVKSLLVSCGERFDKVHRAPYGNSSDDGVEKYPYDYKFCNDKPLEQTEKSFIEFLKKNIL